ncbi:MAG: hypothetical protein M3Y56_02035 [Armatimonadota bacterium]|nr:hypothetical protein [Armatimonadota bacterium]
MQKRFVLPLSAFTVLASLAGCSHSQDKDKAAVNTASTTTAASDTVTTSDAPAPAPPTVIATAPASPTTTTAHTAVTQTAVIPAPRPVNLHPATYIIHRAPLVGGGGAPSTADTVQLIVKNLIADNGMRGSQIHVTQEVSTIRLEGKVNSVAQKNRAEDIVIAVQRQSRRQTGVENELVVNTPPQAQTAAAAGGGPVEVP